MEEPGHRILLVDDEPLIAMAEAEALEGEGYSVSVVYDGEASVEAVRKGEPPIDLVLMDMQLGQGIDGAEAARRILELRDLPILFLTSHAEPSFAARAGDIGSYGYVVKNAGTAALVASFRMALRLHRSHCELKARKAELEARSAELEARSARLAARSAELEESESRLRFALAGANDGIWDVMMDTGQLYMSPRDCEILGYSCEEAPSGIATWSELVHPDDLELTNERLRAHLEGRAPIFDVEQRLRTRSGDWKWIRSRGKVVLRGEHGEALRMTGTHSDISDRVRAERALRESDRLFSALMENSPDFVFILDAEGRSVRMSRNFEQLVGRPLEDMIGKRIPEIFPPEEAERMLADDERAFATGGAIQVLERVAGRLYETTKFPILREGEAGYLAGFSRDVTEAEAMRAQLVASLAEKDLLFREFQHRVKNSLAIVSSLISLEAQRLPDEASRQVLASAERRIEAMASVYDQLNRSAGTGRVSMGPYLEGLASGIAEAYETGGRIRIGVSSAELSLDLAKAAPLGLIVNELLTNAIKYAYPGDAGGAIRLVLSVAGDTAELIVADDGVGLPGSMAPGKQDSLGLRLVETLAGQLHGKVSLGKGPGAEFRIGFPLGDRPPPGA
jgi:PAS domain S-box-containing protein